MIEPSHQDRDDYADGPPPQPWSCETIVLVIGYGCLLAFAFAIALGYLLGPTGN